MSTKILKHHSEELDGTRGAWRPTHQAKKGLVGPDGHPLAWDEGVVMTCPSCGCQFGVGMDSNGSTPRIVDGVTVDVVKCMNPLGCSWVSDGPVEFDKHQEAEGREAYAKKLAQYDDEIAETRVRTMREIIADNHRREADERALAEVKAAIGDGKGPDAAIKLNQFLKNGGKLTK